MGSRDQVEVLRRWARAGLGARARDVTAQTTSRSCLVVAPHPDDETIACGATICRKTAAGADVTIVVVSDGSRSHDSQALTLEEIRAIRKAEADQAAERLGISGPVRFLDFEDGALPSVVGPVAHRLGELISELRPDEVFSPHVAEPHPDHSAVASAVRQAVASSEIAPALWEYGVWMWSAWPWSGQGGLSTRVREPWRPLFTSSVVRVSTSGRLECKRHALDAYASQMTQFRGYSDWKPLPAAFLARFFEPYELFFPVPNPSVKSVGETG